MNHILVERRIFFYTISSMNFILFTNIHFFFPEKGNQNIFSFFYLIKFRKLLIICTKKKKKKSKPKSLYIKIWSQLSYVEIDVRNKSLMHASLQF